MTPDLIPLMHEAGCPEGFISSAVLEQSHVLWIERLATLVRNATLEEAARYCHDASIPQQGEIHTDAQWAAACLAVNIRNLKDKT